MGKLLLDNLNINLTVLLLNGVLFLALLMILNGIFWKPMIKHLEERKNSIKNAYSTVDATRKEMENLRAEYQVRLSKIEAEARGQIQQSVHDAQQLKEQMITEARLKAEKIVEEGAKSIEAEKIQTLTAMRDKLDSVAAVALGKALGSGIDASQKQLIDDYITQNALRS